MLNMADDSVTVSATMSTSSNNGAGQLTESQKSDSFVSAESFGFKSADGDQPTAETEQAVVNPVKMMPLFGTSAAAEKKLNESLSPVKGSAAANTEAAPIVEMNGSKTTNGESKDGDHTIPLDGSIPPEQSDSAQIDQCPAAADQKEAELGEPDADQDMEQTEDKKDKEQDLPPTQEPQEEESKVAEEPMDEDNEAQVDEDEADGQEGATEGDGQTPETVVASALPTLQGDASMAESPGWVKVVSKKAKKKTKAQLSEERTQNAQNALNEAEQEEDKEEEEPEAEVAKGAEDAEEPMEQNSKETRSSSRSPVKTPQQPTTPKEKESSPVGRRSLRARGTPQATDTSTTTPAADNTPVVSRVRRSRGATGTPPAASIAEPESKATANPTPASARASRKRGAATSGSASHDTDTDGAEEDEVEPTPAVKRTRGAVDTAKKTPERKVAPAGTKKAATGPPKQSTSQSSKRRKSVPGAAAASGEDDPFDVDEHLDDHPRPLHKIQVVLNQGKTQFFGTPKSTPGRYSMTQRATAAISGIASPAATSTPSRMTHSIARTTASPRGQKPAATDEDEDMYSEDGDSDTDHKQSTPAKGTPHKTPTKGTPKSAAGTAQPPTPKPATPKSSRKSKLQAPVLTDVQQLEIDQPHNPDNILYQIGARVYGKWGKEFYPAVVVDNIGFGRFRVLFVQDQMQRDMTAPDIVSLARLTVGKRIMVLSELEEEDELLPVTIKQVPSVTDASEWTAGVYLVQDSTGNQSSVKWAQFVIDSEQKLAYAVAVENKAAVDIDSHNISASRTREHRTPVVRLENEPVPAVSERRRSTPKVVKARTVPESSASGARASASKSPSAHKTPTQSQTPPKAQRKATNQRLKSDDEGAAVGGQPGPIFANMAFVLTSASRKQSDGDAKPAFNKRDIRARIADHKGQVIDDFVSTALPANTKLFLVADTHYRTHKYLSAMAHAVPCVSYKWILQCIKMNRLLNHEEFMLPAGESLEQQKLVDWHGKGPHLLEGKNVMVYTVNRPGTQGVLDFVQIWKPLVGCMGVKQVVDQMSDLQPDERVDLLLTDVTCSEEVLAEAQQRNAPAVSSEWLIQAIITGELPDFKGHEKYKYDYVEPQRD